MIFDETIFMHRFKQFGSINLRSLLFISLLGCFAFGLTGCAKSPNAEAESLNKAVDESLSSEELTSQGLPDVNKAWSGDDLTAAAAVLTKIAQEGHQRLPRFQSERSGKVFARLVSRANLEVFRDRNSPVEQRFPEAITFYEKSGEISRLYLEGIIKGQVRDCEVIQLMNNLYLIQVVMLDLNDEYWPTVSPDAPNYQLRTEGLEKIKRSMSKGLNGGFTTLTERSHISDAEMIKLVSGMLETYPQIVPRLLPDAQNQALDRLAQLNADSRLDYLQPGLKELQKRVKVAVENSASAIAAVSSNDLKTVQQVLAEQLGIKLDDVRPDATLAQLKMDDLDFVEIVMTLEEKFDVNISEDSLFRASGNSEPKAWLDRLKVQDLAKIVTAAKKKTEAKP